MEIIFFISTWWCLGALFNKSPNIHLTSQKGEGGGTTLSISILSVIIPCIVKYSSYKMETKVAGELNFALLIYWTKTN